ncbi:putative N6-adenine methyltransferase-domain-containing protein [Globomyces pollinis-pini]|nr:putative N6-adenine methyltransferase-domain-containing protein [Globomyces pollinis-pini]
MEFKNEQKLQDEKLKKLQESKVEVNQLDMLDFKEDWQMSQFWYTNETSNIMATEAVNSTENNAIIGCIASPSAFLALKKINLGDRKPYVFEIDNRFNVFGKEFVHYDFNQPLSLNDLEGTRPLLSSFDYLIVDPPFLAPECFEKVSITIDALLKPNGKIMVASGLVMTDFVAGRLNCKRTCFDPKHRNGLSNEFGSFINYESNSTEFRKI